MRIRGMWRARNRRAERGTTSTWWWSRCGVEREERERKGERAIRVGVSDEEEPPEAPAAPAVTPEGSEQLEGELDGA